MDRIMPTISIVIPAYNSGLYIGNCLKSIQNQSYKTLEIIVIDDGSSDNTLIIANQFASNDNRIKVFHKENGGQSSARNEGLKYITGEYFTFVDSDDEITENYIINLFGLIKQYNADISMCGLQYIENGRTINKYCYENSVVSGTDDIIKTFLMEKHMFGPVSKLFKASLFSKIYFIEGTIFEDVEYLSRVYQRCSKIVMGNEPDYKYYIRNNSTVHAVFDTRKYDLIHMTRQVVMNVVSGNFDCADELLRFELNGYISFLLLCSDANMIREHIEIYNELISWLQLHIREILSNKKVERKLKLYTLCFVDKTNLLLSILGIVRKALR